MKIPKRFKIFSHTYEVDLADDLFHNENIWGKVRYRLSQISLQSDKSPDAPRPLPFVKQTFWHEILHVIFFHLGEKELDDNEKLVERMSESLAQIIETMEWEEE